MTAHDCACVYFVVYVQEGHDNWVRAIGFSGDGKYVVSASDDKSVRVWDLKQLRCIRTIDGAHKHFVTSLTLSHKFPFMATGCVDATASVWSCK